MSTVSDIFEQAKALSTHERQELVNLLSATLTGETKAPVNKPVTGAEIVAAIKTLEPVEFVDEHLTDPVEWL